MAETKISGMTPKAVKAAVTDLFEITEDLSGTPITKSVTGQNIVGCHRGRLCRSCEHWCRDWC
jgi:hypothetical protein